MPFRVLLRLAFWAALLAISLLALLPQPPEVVPGASDVVQHLLAFCLLSCLLPAAHPGLPLPTAAALLAGYGGLIEILQLIPALNRSSELADWLVDLSAIAVVLPAATWAARRIRLRAGRT